MEQQQEENKNNRVGDNGLLGGGLTKAKLRFREYEDGDHSGEKFVENWNKEVDKWERLLGGGIGNDALGTNGNKEQKEKEKEEDKQQAPMEKKDKGRRRNLSG